MSENCPKNLFFIHRMADAIFIFSEILALYLLISNENKLRILLLPYNLDNTVLRKFGTSKIWWIAFSSVYIQKWFRNLKSKYIFVRLINLYIDSILLLISAVVQATEKWCPDEKFCRGPEMTCIWMHQYQIQNKMKKTFGTIKRNYIR